MSKKGSIVISESGRDKGIIFAVIDEVDNFLVIADGRKRRIECPKRKNAKHVRILNCRLTEDAMKKLDEKTLTNKSLYHEIKKSFELSI